MKNAIHEQTVETIPKRLESLSNPGTNFLNKYLCELSKANHYSGRSSLKLLSTDNVDTSRLSSPVDLGNLTEGCTS